MRKISRKGVNDMWLGLPWYTWIGIGVPFIMATLLPLFLVSRLTSKRRNSNHV